MLLHTKTLAGSDKQADVLHMRRLTILLIMFWHRWKNKEKIMQGVFVLIMLSSLSPQSSKFTQNPLEQFMEALNGEY